MVKFFYYDLVFLILFSLAVAIFLYIRRDNLKREGLMYLYRTQVGIKFINYVGGKYKRTLKFFSYISITCGYFLMGTMLYLLGQITWVYFMNPELVRAIKVPPLMPLIPYLPSMFKIDFLPPFYFTYWIISIAIIAIFHEFAHGIFAKYNGIRIKTTGFGFLGPFLAAFVEPDEADMEKKGKFAQITVLSAGTFVNVILAVFFFLMLSLFFVATYVPAGAMFNTYSPGIVSISDIDKIDGVIVINPSHEGLIDIIDNEELTKELVIDNGASLEFVKIIVDGRPYYTTPESLKNQLIRGGDQVALFEDFPAINAGLKGVIIEVDGQEIKAYSDLSNVMNGFSPGDFINVKTKFDDEIVSYDLVLGEDPNTPGRAIMGIGNTGRRSGIMSRFANMFNFFKEPATNYEPKYDSNLIIFIYNLIWWIALINISVALVNMLPVGIFDGGRMFMLTVWGITGSEKIAMAAFKFMTYLILGVFLLMMFGWVVAIF